MSTINFETKLLKIGKCTILLLPQSASDLLPSRGMTMVEGTINGRANRQADFPFQAPLEPDGRGSHWFRVKKMILEAIGVDEGDSVHLAIKLMKEWSEPDVPEDLMKALDLDQNAHALWKAITPMARWDWIRWIRATKQAETRKRRIVVACSKLNKGMKRPCCFNRTLCTDPSVSHNGVLNND
jgi:hypothetical protein